MTTKAKLYISWIAAVGLIVLVAGLSHWQSTGLPRLLAFLFLAMVLSTQKIRLPGMKRSEEHTSELQSQSNLVCRLLLEKKNRHRSCLKGDRLCLSPRLSA